MNVLVACEYSGTVRDEFRKRGHMAMSCDLRPDDNNSEWHFRGDVRDALRNIAWDMIIAFPPCDHLSSVGARYWDEKKADGRLGAAVDFVKLIADADCPRIVIENPTGILSRVWRAPDQIIHPYLFGEPWQKRTCLWLKGVPPLEPTNVVEPQGHWVQTTALREDKVPGRRGQKVRARTFMGVARAMATQWG